MLMNPTDRLAAPSEGDAFELTPAALAYLAQATQAPKSAAGARPPSRGRPTARPAQTAAGDERRPNGQAELYSAAAR